jgi:hypothetical protein
MEGDNYESVGKSRSTSAARQKAPLSTVYGEGLETGVKYMFWQPAQAGFVAERSEAVRARF